METSVLRDRTDRLAARWVPAAVVGLAGVLWLSSVNWKVPPDFGDTADGCSRLCGFVQDGIDHPVVPPSGWILDHVVQPQLELFGWVTLLTEVALAALLLSRRHLRVAAVLGVAQSLAIGLTVANAPDEWYWAYLLMAGLHLAVLGFAAGLRPVAPRAMAVAVGVYGAMVAVAHAGAGFTGGGDDPWTLFAGSDDIPDEFGRGTFPGSLALGLVLVAVAVGVWLLAGPGTGAQVRAVAGYGLVALALVLLLTYRSEGLAIGLGSRAVTAAVLAAAGLALAGDRGPSRRARARRGPSVERESGQEEVPSPDAT